MRILQVGDLTTSFALTSWLVRLSVCRLFRVMQSWVRAEPATSF